MEDRRDEEIKLSPVATFLLLSLLAFTLFIQIPFDTFIKSPLGVQLEITSGPSRSKAGGQCLDGSYLAEGESTASTRQKAWDLAIDDARENCEQNGAPFSVCQPFPPCVPELGGTPEAAKSCTASAVRRIVNGQSVYVGHAWCDCAVECVASERLQRQTPS